MIEIYTVIDWGGHNSSDGFPSPREVTKCSNKATAEFVCDVLNNNFGDRFSFPFSISTEILEFRDNFPDEEEVIEWYRKAFVEK